MSLFVVDRFDFFAVRNGQLSTPNFVWPSFQNPISHHTYLTQSSYGMMGEGWADHSPVPADLGMDVVDIACKITLTTSFVFADGIRLSLEPESRFDSHLFSARLSKSDFPLSIEDERAASERFDSSSKDIERLPLHSFSLLVFQPLLSGLTEVFLHMRCVSHQ